MIKYIWFKLCKKIAGSAIKNSHFEKTSKCEAGSIIVNSEFGKYSYCGYDCTIINAKIGKFCSISDNVLIGMSTHPINWVSTSPAFYRGRDSIPKILAKLEYDSSSKITTIGNDVWIGANVLIKDGIKIGDGAVIGMGSIITKNVEPYTIVAGNPAKPIRKRFSDDTIEKLLKIKWWNKSDDELRNISSTINNIDLFVENQINKK